MDKELFTREEVESYLTDCIANFSKSPGRLFPHHAHNVEQFQALDESDIAKSLSATILTLELTNRFKDLIKVRNSVILLSHCAGHCLEIYSCIEFDFIYSLFEGHCVNTETDFDDLPKNSEDILQLSTDVPLNQVTQLRLIMKGIRTKRGQRLLGSTKTIDNPFRQNFLNFLTQCWVISGASDKEIEIGNLNMSDKVKLVHIHAMESVISQILSDFIFLGYKECELGNNKKISLILKHFTSSL
jgi:hypothetical protein